jgi:hypothetical protein
MSPISKRSFINKRMTTYMSKDPPVAAIEMIWRRFSSEIVNMYSTKIRAVKEIVSISRKEVSKISKDSNIMIEAFKSHY